MAGSVAGTYWFLMLIGRLFGAGLGAKISTKTMLITGSSLGLVLVLLAILLPTSIQVSLPVLMKSEVGSLSLAFANVPINAMFLVLIGLCTSIMWGGIFNLAVEGLGKYVAIASGIFMTMVVGGGIIPLVQNFFADRIGYLPSYWVMAACLTYLLWFAFVGSKHVNKDIPVD
jgi:FHS family L-fucose permease-like MFS transporter